VSARWQVATPLPSARSVTPAVLGARFQTSAALRQGLALVHFTAQPEPFLTQKHIPNTP